MGVGWARWLVVEELPSPFGRQRRRHASHDAAVVGPESNVVTFGRYGAIGNATAIKPALIERVKQLRV
jgi:hypothetical protein